MLIKICGLTRPSDARLAEMLGADYLGVIMAGGPRNLSAESARAVLGPRRHNVRRVAVFGAQPRTEIAQLAEDLSLDVVQLHGDPLAEDVTWLRERVDVAVWPVVRVEGTELPAGSASLATAAGTVLLDAKVVGHLGGTGVALNWQELQHEVQALREQVPGVQLVLAGGLKDSNVQFAAGMLAPEIVDVSSGVEEAPGIKNASALEAFITAARATIQNTGTR